LRNFISEADARPRKISGKDLKNANFNNNLYDDAPNIRSSINKNQSPLNKSYRNQNGKIDNENMFFNDQSHE